MVTTFAEYLLAEKEGSFETRPVSHNLISLCCSLSLFLSLSISSDRIREGMKEISFSSFHFGKTGQREVGVAGVVCGDRFGACICSGKGKVGWSTW